MQPSAAPRDPQPPSAAPTPEPGAPRTLASSELLQGERFVEIRHNGEVYRLQATRLGKLILTK
ncbi:MAG TPA: hemin uptake protein HemP [Ramlibacter sp.]|nr:hemin uptake protein HemP [Ramlibacter sp.]